MYNFYLIKKYSNSPTTFLFSNILTRDGLAYALFPFTCDVKQSTSGCLYSHIAAQIFLPLTNLMFASKSVSLTLQQIGANRYTNV